ncbi:MAG: molybdenum cofactor biosynthesis protein MoaE [Hyphomicrobiales bacterium]
MGAIFVDICDVATQPLDVMAGLAFVTRSPNGAENLFVGTVRGVNQGKEVLGVSYDVFESLAKRSFTDICAEARAKWGRELSLYVTHGKGRLPVGGVGIVIAVGAPHRDEAFKACRYVIEQVKHRSPICKLEHYADGDSEWTKGCELCTHEHEVAGHGRHS